MLARQKSLRLRQHASRGFDNLPGDRRTGPVVATKVV